MTISQTDINTLSHRIDELGFLLSQLDLNIIYTLPKHLFPLKVTSQFGDCILYLKTELERLREQHNPAYQLFLMKQISHKINILAKYYDLHKDKKRLKFSLISNFKVSSYEAFVKQTNANIQSLLTQKSAIEEAIQHDDNAPIERQLERQKVLGHIEQQLSQYTDALDDFMSVK